MNMRDRLEEIRIADVKKPMPVLSFPCVQLMGMNVRELLSDPDNQANGMKAVADRTDSFAALGFMNLSLEAEAFGADVKISDTNVPVVTAPLTEDIEAAEKLEIPVIKEGRALENPELLHILLRKSTDFLTEYIKAYRSIGADGIFMAEPLAGMLSPELAEGTPEDVRRETLKLLEKCSVHPNFLISSGCDIPPFAKWENIDAFFEAAGEFYSR